MNAVLIDSMGGDLTAVNAARVSFAKKKDVMDEKDERLIRYLASHKHWTPFGHIILQFRITAPIFVARQWYRHTVGFARNEESRRYIRNEPSVFHPTNWRSKPEGSIKQGSGSVHQDSHFWDKDYKDLVDRSLRFYNKMIEDGVAPEQARMVLPQATETSWVETASLYAYARLCNERMQPDAQVEIRDLAEMVYNEAKEIAPVSWKELVYV